MGDVVHVHIDESVYVGVKGAHRHRVDLLKDVDMRPLGRLGRANYVRLREIEARLRKGWAELAPVVIRAQAGIQKVSSVNDLS